MKHKTANIDIRVEPRLIERIDAWRSLQRMHRRRFLASSLIVFLAIASALPWSRALAGPAEDKALRDAAGCGGRTDIETVKRTLKLGGNPNALSSTGLSMSPLHCAMLQTLRRKVESNLTALEVAKVLFASGAKLSPTDREILFGPIAAGDVDIVRLLIENGASPTAALEGYTPPELAIKYDQVPVYKYLLSRGGIPVGQQTQAQIRFVHAAGYGDKKGMEEAIDAGARVNGTDPNNESALVEALMNGVYEQSQAEAIWWLLDRKADPNQKSGGNGYELPLQVFVVANKATLEGGFSNYPEAKSLAEETFRRLLHAGAKVSIMDSRGWTPLHVAAKVDNVRAAELLIAEGAKVMPRDKSGKTPLDYAESAPMIKLLKANGATEN
jgi:ankyrin repeat protein